MSIFFLELGEIFFGKEDRPARTNTTRSEARYVASADRSSEGCGR